MEHFRNEICECQAAFCSEQHDKISLSLSSSSHRGRGHLSCCWSNSLSATLSLGTVIASLKCQLSWKTPRKLAKRYCWLCGIFTKNEWVTEFGLLNRMGTWLEHRAEEEAWADTFWGRCVWFGAAMPVDVRLRSLQTSSTPATHSVRLLHGSLFSNNHSLLDWAATGLTRLQRAPMG